jgi:glycosyltransferase involved in cell wall biosynthesis
MGLDEVAIPLGARAITLTLVPRLPRAAVPQVVQVVGYYPPHVGGVEFCASNISRELTRRGIAVTVLTSELGAGEAVREPVGDTAQSPSVQRLRALEIAHTPLIPGLPWRLWRASRAAVIHLHISHVWSDVTATLVAWLGRRPLVAHFHMDTPTSGRLGFAFSWYKRRILGWLLRRAGAVVALSQEQGELVSLRYGVPSSRVRVIPNGVAGEFFTGPRATVQTDPKRPLRLLFVGRLAAQKDLPLLIATAETLGDAVSLDIVGDGELRREIAHLVDAVPSGRIRMWGALSGDALIERYREADVFVMTSVREGMPLALLEAMATGLPVVASDVQGLREFVGGVGVLAKERTVEGFAAAVRELADDPDRLGRLSEASRRAVQSRRWDALTDDVLAAYALAGGDLTFGHPAADGLQEH